MDINPLERAIMHLIREERWYAEVIMQLDRKEDPKIPGGTAAVGIRPRPTLYYHPDLFANNDLQTNVQLLKHEVVHLLNQHLTRTGGTMNRLQNAAADLAVNSFIDGFQGLKTKDPDGQWTFKKGCTVENMKDQFPSLIKGQTMEWYIAALKQDGATEGGAPDTSDDHSKWSEGDSSGSELEEYAVKGIMQTAVERTQRAGGQVPDGLRDLLKSLLSSKSQWQRELQRFPQDAEIVGTEDTWRRRNRRLGSIVPGSKKVRKVKVCVGIDVSGSVDGPLLQLFYAEIDKIAQHAEVVASFFDHCVQKTLPWSEVRKLSKIPGGGGTCFQPMLDEATKIKADGLIMLTDGMNGDTITRPKYPVIWAVPEQYNYVPQFGKLVNIADPK
jgi:predicted metal-dependent peptidase